MALLWAGQYFSHQQVFHVVDNRLWDFLQLGIPNPADKTIVTSYVRHIDSVLQEVAFGQIRLEFRRNPHLEASLVINWNELQPQYRYQISLGYHMGIWADWVDGAGRLRLTTYQRGLYRELNWNNLGNMAAGVAPPRIFGRITLLQGQQLIEAQSQVEYQQFQADLTGFLHPSYPLDNLPVDDPFPAALKFSGNPLVTLVDFHVVRYQHSPRGRRYFTVRVSAFPLFDPTENMVHGGVLAEIRNIPDRVMMLYGATDGRLEFSFQRI